MPGQEVVTTKVVVHPLVLLSVVDHFNRMGKIGNQKRVVGVLLGCWRAKGVLDVSNSFAGTFFLDPFLLPLLLNIYIFNWLCFIPIKKQLGL